MFKTLEHEKRFAKFLIENEKMEYDPKKVAYMYVVSTLPIDTSIIKDYIKEPKDLNAYQMQIHEMSLNLLGDKEKNCELKDLLSLESEDLKMMLNAIAIAAGKVTLIVADKDRVNYYKGI